MRSLASLFILAGTIASPAFASEVVPVAAFNSVELRGGGSVTIRPAAVQRVIILSGSSRVTRFRVNYDGQLRIDACNSQCPRNYDLHIQIESPQVPDLGISGGGDMHVTAGFDNQGQLSAAVNGGGAIDARAVDAASVSAAVNGGGRISVRPLQSLSAAVNGGGEVVYWGNPSVSTAIHGGGLVRPGS